MSATGGFACRLRALGTVQDHNCAGRRERDEEQSRKEDAAGHAKLENE